MTGAQAPKCVCEATTSSCANPRLLHVLGTDLDGDLICMVRLRATDRTCRLAYILREEAWGHGHATGRMCLLLARVSSRRPAACHPGAGNCLCRSVPWRTRARPSP